METQKEKYEDFYRATSIDGKNKGSKTITRAKGENIVQLLANNENADDFNPKFKHWVKTRGFQLITDSALGLTDVLCLPAKTKVVSHNMIVNRVLSTLEVYNFTNQCN